MVRHLVSTTLGLEGGGRRRCVGSAFAGMGGVALARGWRLAASSRGRRGVLAEGGGLQEALPQVIGSGLGEPGAAG